MVKSIEQEVQGGRFNPTIIQKNLDPALHTPRMIEKRSFYLDQVLTNNLIGKMVVNCVLSPDMIAPSLTFPSVIMICVKGFPFPIGIDMHRRQKGNPLCYYIAVILHKTKKFNIIAHYPVVRQSTLVDGNWKFSWSRE